MVKEIEPVALKQLLNSDEVRLIDVRTPQEVAQGALPRAVNIPLHLIPLHISEFTPDKTWVIYCRSGARSAQACAFLADHGIANTLNLQGGIMAWASQGLNFS